MTRERAKELLPVIQAFAEGKTIQLKMAGEWTDAIGGLLFDNPPSNYRIKPEPREWWVPNGICICYSVSEAITSGINREQFRLFREVEGAKL